MAIIVLEDIAISYSGSRFRFYGSLFSLSEKLLRRFQGSISSWEPVVFSIRNVSKWRRTKAWSVSSQLAVEMIHYQLRSLMAPDPYAKQCFTVHEGASPSNHLVCDIHQPLHTVSGYYNLTDLQQPQLISDPKDALGKPQDRGGNQLFYTKEPGAPCLMGHQAGREGCDFNVFQQPAEILREALSQDNGSIDRIEIKFPSGYVRAELP